VVLVVTPTPTSAFDEAPPSALAGRIELAKAVAKATAKTAVVRIFMID
jgi:hypothetical protein